MDGLLMENPLKVDDLGALKFQQTSILEESTDKSSIVSLKLRGLVWGVVIHPCAMGVPMNMDCALQLLTMGTYVWDVLWKYKKGIHISKYLQSVYSISNGAGLVNPVGDCISPFMAMPKPQARSCAKSRL